MPNNNPEKIDKNPFDQGDDDPLKKLAAQLQNKNALIKSAAALGVRTLTELAVLKKDGFAEWRKWRRDTADIHGLTEGSILSAHLAHPAEEGFVYEQAENGDWLGYDFNRPKDRVCRQRNGEMRLLCGGRLGGFLIEAVKANPSDVRTPTRLLNLFDLTQIYSFDFMTGESATEAGLVMSTTYTKAYKAVGAYEQFADNLHELGVADEQVHQVTPKGNGLVFLVGEFGDTTPPKEAPQRQRSFGLLPGIILGPGSAGA